MHLPLLFDVRVVRVSPQPTIKTNIVDTNPSNQTIGNMCRKLRLLNRIDETPLNQIYGFFLRFSFFYIAFGILEIVYSATGTLSMVSAISKISLGLDLLCLNIRGARGGSLNVVLLYIGAALALTCLVISVVGVLATGFSVTMVVISLLVVLLSGPIVLILLKTAQRESTGADEPISAGLAEPIATPIAYADKV